MVEIVPCTPEYWEFVRELRNDERVADGFIEQVHITPEQQQAYMAKYSSNYFIAVVDNIPVGYVGSIDRDIRICTSPDFQGTGVGKVMLNFIMEKFPYSYGKVKLHNKASRQLFESCGFKETFVIYTK